MVIFYSSDQSQFDGNRDWSFDCSQEEHEDRVEVEDWTEQFVSDQSVGQSKVWNCQAQTEETHQGEHWS